MSEDTDTTARPTPSMPTPQPESTPAASEETGQQPTIDELPEARPQVGFLQQRWVQTVLPFATSFIFHAAILLAGFLLIEPITVAYTIVKEQIIIPDAQLIEGATPGGIPNPGLGDDPNRAAAQDQIQDVPSDPSGLAASQVQTLNQTLVAGGSGDESINPLARGGMMRGPGSGPGSGLGGETGGGIAPFGMPGGGGGIGPKSNFMGQGGGNAYRLALLCDASGSMIGKDRVLLEQIRKTVSQLKPVQGFNIIFFSEGDPVALDARRLVMATPEGKRRAYDFLNNMVTGTKTNPLPALEMAFKQDVQLIYFLTDGDFNFDLNANDKVLAKIRELNKDGNVKINTIAFVSGEGEMATQTQGFVQLLQQIANENGGRFSIVNASAFGG